MLVIPEQARRDQLDQLLARWEGGVEDTYWLLMKAKRGKNEDPAGRQRLRTRLKLRRSREKIFG